MKRLYFAEQWNKWSQLSIAPGAPAYQRQAMRVAFYSGAIAVRRAMAAAGCSAKLPPVAGDIDSVNGVIDELNHFFENLENELPPALDKALQ